MTLNRFVIPVLAATLLSALPAVARPSSVPAEPVAYGQEPWEMPPGEFNEIQRRGFHDGVEGARRDYGNHRNPDVNNREEYRNANFPPEVREVYRAAYRRGYETAASHLWGGPPPPPPVPQPQPNIPAWEGWGMRGLDNDAARRGYHEGVEAARRDVQMQHRTDPDDHQEFRNPPVPPEMAGEFREGFMRGYEVAISQLSGEPAWQGRGEPGQWQPPERFTEIGRRGFQDGVEGARKDFGNHRRPDVVNREEYRNPHVPPEAWHDYREGFRRGYEMMAARLWGGQ